MSPAMNPTKKTDAAPEPEYLVIREHSSHVARQSLWEVLTPMLASREAAEQEMTRLASEKQRRKFGRFLAVRVRYATTQAVTTEDMRAMGRLQDESKFVAVRDYSSAGSRKLLWKVLTRPIKTAGDALGWLGFCQTEEGKGKTFRLVEILATTGTGH